MSSCVALARPNKHEIVPGLYFKAGGELFGILFVVSWTVTALFNPSVIFSNPLVVILGYPNVCVGFDTQPATSVALFLYCFIAYTQFRFAVTDIERTVLIKDRLSQTQFRFSISADIVYALSIATFSLVFVLNPFDDGVWKHSLPFFSVIVGRYFVVVANFMESDQPLTMGQKTFLLVLTVASLGFMACVTVDFVEYGAHCTPDCGDWVGPQLPWQITASFDYLWMICLPLTTKMLPISEKICCTYEAVPQALGRPAGGA